MRSYFLEILLSEILDKKFLLQFNFDSDQLSKEIEIGNTKYLVVNPKIRFTKEHHTTLVSQNSYKQSYDLLFRQNFEIDVFLQESIKENIAPYLFFIKKHIPSSNIDQLEYLTPDLSFKEVEHLDNADHGLVREFIYSSMVCKYSQLYSKEGKSNFIKLHLPALDKTLNQKYILCYQGNQLIAFISWFNLIFLSKFDAIVSTHWMSQRTDYLIRKKIHKYFFNHLSSISKDFMAASIFFKNTASIDFFKKNNYTLFSLKVLNF